MAGALLGARCVNPLPEREKKKKNRREIRNLNGPHLCCEHQQQLRGTDVNRRTAQDCLSANIFNLSMCVCVFVRSASKSCHMCACGHFELFVLTSVRQIAAELLQSCGVSFVI